MKEKTFKKKMNELMFEFMSENEMPESFQVIISQGILMAAVAADHLCDMVKLNDDKVEIKNKLVDKFREAIFR